MASSVSSNGGSNNVMMRSKADSRLDGAAGGHATSLDERSTTVGTGTTMMGTTATATGVASGPERGAVTTADDSAISFSEEEEDEVDEDEDEDEEDDSGSLMADHQPESASASATAAAFNAAAAAAAAAAFQRQLLANFPLFHGSSDGSTKMDNDPSANSDMRQHGAMDSNNVNACSGNNSNPFETYIAAAAAAAAAAANAEALFRHQQQLTALSGGSRSEKRTAAHDSGTDDNEISIHGGKSQGRNPSAGIHQQQPSNKRRKQSKPVRISSEVGGNEEAVTAFLAAQTAALFHQNPNASSEEEEEGSIHQPNTSASSANNKRIEWSSQPMMASNESEQEEGQIIRSSSASSAGQMLDQQLANRMLSMAGNSSSRNLAEFLASGGSGGKGGFPLFPPSAYGGSWNQQQQMMMSMMAMNRSSSNNGMMGDDGEVSRSSSHSSASPNGGVGGSGSHPDVKKNEESGGERSNSESPFAFRNMPKYGPTSAGGGFFPSSSAQSSTLGPSTSSASHPFLFPFLTSANSPVANQPMRGAMTGSPSVGGGIRIFNHEAYCELCNKEFCNKYFLKTHKANKHGIYVDNMPTSSGGSTPSQQMEGAIRSGPTTSTPTSSSSNNIPFSVSSSFGPPLSLTVGAMTYPMHPPQTELTPAETSVSYSPIQPVSQPVVKPAYVAVTAPTSVTTTTTTSSTTTPTGINAAAAAAAAAGLMDFFPLWSSTTTPPVTTINNTLAGPPSLVPSVATMKQHLPGGIVNPEAYCELCQKEFCNKYFLKRHKAKMHGIVPPDGSGTVATGANSSATTGSSHPAGPSSSGSTSHKRSKSQGAKIPSSAVDLIKIPLTLSVGPARPVTSPAALPAVNEPSVQQEQQQTSTVVDQSNAESNGSTTTTAATATTATTTPFNLLMASAGINNETGGGSGPSIPAKLDLSNSGNNQRTDSLSLLKIPTPSLSTLFSSPPPSVESHPAARQHAKTPSSSSSSGGGVGQQPQQPQQQPQQQQQQLFSPERLRQMGVINTEAFCEICCKEFCNKYFLRTHKFKKHGIGSMPEQPQHQSQSMSESSSSTGMIHQHHYNNNNNNKNGSPSTKQHQVESEQKIPLNLASSSTPPTSAGSVQPDGGMPLSCDLCQRPFQSAYLLHMHRTYFHNQPPPAEDSGTAENDMDVSTAGADDENGSDNEEEEEAGSPAPVAVKSEPGIQRNADVPEDGAVGGDNSGVTISADLQKLQSMIMELNGSSASSAAAAAAASLADGDAALRRRCWMDGPTSKNAANPPSNNSETGNNTHFISGSGGGIVKIVNPGDPASSSDPANPSGSMSTVCQLCGNKDFFTSYFLQMHMQNYHGIVVNNSGSASDPSAAAMEAAVAAAASQLGLDRLLDFGPQNGGGGGGSQGMNKRSGRSSSSASPAATRSYCQICNKELCNKYFMKTHMLKMHGIHLEASGGGAQIGGVQCDICHKELCSKYFLKVHKQNTHGIGFADNELMPNGAGMGVKDVQHQGVMDLSFHHGQPMLDSPSKSSTTTECCPLCPKRFKSAKALKAHLSHDHSATTSSGSSGSSTCCYICSQQFHDVVALQVHLIKSHASHLMDHQTPPPQQASTPSATANASVSAGQHEQANPGGSVSSSSSPSSKTLSSPSFQCSFCDFATGSLPYLFAHERSHHPLDRPPATTSSSSANHSPQAASQQKIQCPLCGQQLGLEQFQTHLMAHQLPINFLHTLMPSTASASGLAGPSQGDEMDEDEFQQQQQHGQQQEEKQERRIRQRRRRRYRCSVCSRKFSTRQLCLTHILQRHPPSIRSGSHNNGLISKIGSVGLSSPTSPVSCLVQQQRPLTCPRCGYATRQPQLLRLHLRTQQCIPVVARNPDLQQLPPYLAVPTSTASVGHVNAQSRAVNNNGLLQVQGQHAHRQDFVLQAFLLTQPDADKSGSSGTSQKNRRSKDGQPDNQQNGHHQDQNEIKREHQQQQHNGRRPDAEDVKRTPEESAVDADDGEEEGQNQSCNFIPSLILLPVNRRIANPLSLTFSLTPA